MKIAFVVSQFPALSETFILNQITGLIDRGHTVSIFAANRGVGQVQHADVDRYELLSRTSYFGVVPRGNLARIIIALWSLYKVSLLRPRSLIATARFWKYGGWSRGLRAIFGLQAFCRSDATFDVIHCHFTISALSALMARDAGLVSGKLVATFHRPDTPTTDGTGLRLYKYLFFRADLLLPVSEHGRQALLRIGAPADKTLVHHMGVGSFDSFGVEGRVYTGKELNALTVCRLVEKKGVEVALRALAEARRHDGCLIKYTIIGDGHLSGQLKALASQLGLTGNVEFLGPRTSEEVAASLLRADFFVLPSVTVQVRGHPDVEGIPVSIMEAMMCHLPILSSLHAGIPEIVEDGVSGFLVPEGDVQGLAEAMRRLSCDRSLLRSMGEAAATKASSEYNISILNARLETLFQNLAHVAEVGSD